MLSCFLNTLRGRDRTGRAGVKRRCNRGSEA